MRFELPTSPEDSTVLRIAMASPSRSLSDLRRKRGQELAALNHVKRRGQVLLDIDGTRAELWAILKELDDALKKIARRELELLRSYYG